MQTFFFAAFIACCMAFPGKVHAENCTPSSTELGIQMPATYDTETLEWIFQGVSENTGHSVAQVERFYDLGEMTIQQDGHVYTVWVPTKDGGGLIATILEEL